VGLFGKRQRTFDEMIELVKLEARGFPILKTENQVQEFLNTYLRLTFSVNGWWSDRMVKLMIARKFDEINDVEQLFGLSPESSVR
jgi:hypothetical protein